MSQVRPPGPPERAEPPQDWLDWQAGRDARLRSAGGPLALTGTHWFDDELELDGVPGRWRATGRTATLTASAGDGVLVDGRPLDGTVEVRSDLGTEPTDVRVGPVRLLLVERDGLLAVRVYDPEAVSRSGFQEVRRFDHDPTWVLPARFTPYEQVQQVVVPNADGVDRPLPLGGRVTFTRDGVDVSLQVEVDEEDGVLQAVFTDATSAADYPDPARPDPAYRFRFVLFDPPDRDGATVADLNRAYLPPCAFSEFFVCPFPPPGNTLDVAVAAGERAVRWDG